jgi:hypothetical protein
VNAASGDIDPGDVAIDEVDPLLPCATAAKHVEFLVHNNKTAVFDGGLRCARRVVATNLHDPEYAIRRPKEVRKMFKRLTAISFCSKYLRTKTFKKSSASSACTL